MILLIDMFVLFSVRPLLLLMHIRVPTKCSILSFNCGIGAITIRSAFIIDRGNSVDASSMLH